LARLKNLIMNPIPKTIYPKINSIKNVHSNQTSPK
jgi:hypothetical protein